MWAGLGALPLETQMLLMLTLVLASVSALVLIIYRAVQGARAAMKEQRADLEALREKLQASEITEAQSTWELGRAKLEAYLDRNLEQVRSIYWASLCVMVAGFVLIAAGAILVAADDGAHGAPHAAHTAEAASSEDDAADGAAAVAAADTGSGSGGFDAATLSTLAGILVEFIGGTLMVLYNSTMKQAQSNVQVLERINAVGMSVQILEGVSDPEKLDQARIDLASKLLTLYGNLPSTDA